MKGKTSTTENTEDTEREEIERMRGQESSFVG